MFRLGHWINVFFISLFFIVLLVFKMASVAGFGKEAAMLIKHGKVGVPGSCSLLIIHASSGRLDCSGNFGNSFPFADVLAPIIFNGLETVGDTFVRCG